MTIEINNAVLYYWGIAMLYETVHLYFAVKEIKAGLTKFELWPMIKGFYDGSASAQVLWSKINGPLGWISMAVFIIVVSPFMFPLSVITLFKKMIGYKSKLEQEAEKEIERSEAAKKKAEEFMRTEGVRIDPIETNGPDMNPDWEEGYCIVNGVPTSTARRHKADGRVQLYVDVDIRAGVDCWQPLDMQFWGTFTPRIK